MPVLGVSAHALWIAGEYGWAEALLVPSAVASLPRCAASLLCLAPVLFTSPALGVLGAPGYRAYPVLPASGHDRLQVRSLCTLGVVSVKKADVPLGLVVAGLVLMIGCRLITWWPGVIVGAALILGVLASAAMKRRTRK